MLIDIIYMAITTLTIEFVHLSIKVIYFENNLNDNRILNFDNIVCPLSKNYIRVVTVHTFN
jgi:hypothetical protein